MLSSLNIRCYGNLDIKNTELEERIFFLQKAKLQMLLTVLDRIHLLKLLIL